MGKTNREMELEATDLKISEAKREIESKQQTIKIAEALVSLEQDERYQLVFQKTFIDDEADRLAGLLTGDAFLPESAVKQINNGLETIRNLKAIITSTKVKAKEAVIELDRMSDTIEELNAYRVDVFNNKVDVGE